MNVDAQTCEPAELIYRLAGIGWTVSTMESIEGSHATTQSLRLAVTVQLLYSTYAAAEAPLGPRFPWI